MLHTVSLCLSVFTETDLSSSAPVIYVPLWHFSHSHDLFQNKKIKRGKLEKIYQLILWKWKTEIAFLRNQLHIWLLKQQNKKYQIDESKNNQKARNKRPNLHNLWGNNCQFSDNIFQWHFHLFRELEDGVVFPYKLNCSCVKKRLHVYIVFFLNMYIYIYI